MIEHAHEITFRIVADRFDSRRVWIVATDAAIGAEPHHLFAIDKDGVDMIRAQPTEGAFESKVHDIFCVLEMKNAATIRSDPHCASRAGAQSSHWTSRQINFGKSGLICRLVAATFFLAAFDSGPDLAVGIGFESAHEVGLWAAVDGPRAATIDFEQAAAGGSGK